MTDDLRPPPEPEACELCGRAGAALTKHHLIPKTRHNKPSIRKRFSRAERLTRILWVCRPCHDHIHRCFSEATLASRLNRREALLAEPEIREFIQWIGQRPTGFKPKRPVRKRRGH